MAYALGHFTSNFNLSFITVGCNSGIFWFPDGSDPLRDSITNSYMTFLGRYGEQSGVDYWVNYWNNGGAAAYGGSVSNMIQDGAVASGELGAVNAYGRHSGMTTGGCPVYGCTDPLATNYNPSAQFDNGSCTYNPPTLVNFNIDKQDGSDAGIGTVPYGQSVNLRWNVSGKITSVSISGGIGVVSSSGSRSFSPTSSGSYIFTLTATGPGGVTTGNYGFIVAAPPPPYVSFSISTNSITVGNTATLSWSVSGVISSISIDQGIGSISNSGTRVVSPTSAGTYVYTLTANGPGGTTQQNVTLFVSNPPPPTVSFSGSPTTVARGYPVILSWSVSGINVTSVSIDNGIGAVSFSGSRTIYPSSPPDLPWALLPDGYLAATTTYNITATNAGGSTTQQVVVTIRTPIVLELSGSQTIVAGETGYLQWTIAGDYSNLTINNGVGNVSYEGDRTIDVYPTTTTTYALTATNPQGFSVTDYHTINVLPTRPMATLNFTSPGSFNLPATISEFTYTVEGGGGGGGGYDAGSPGGTGGSGARIQGTIRNVAVGSSIQVYVGKGGGAGAGGRGNGSGGSGATNSYGGGGSGGSGGNSGPGGWSGAGGGGGAAGVLVYSGTVLVVAGAGGGGGGGGNDGGYNSYQTGGDAGGLSTSLNLGSGGNASNHGGDGGGGGGGGGGSPAGSNGFTPGGDSDAGGGSGGGSYYNISYHSGSPSFSYGPGGGGSETNGADGVITITYAEDDFTPNPILDFTTVTGATPSTTYTTTGTTSGNRTITGINVPVSASASNGATIIKNGVNLGTSTTTVVNGDVLGLSMTSPTTYSASKTSTLAVGGVNANWAIFTNDLPTSVPNPYDFTDLTGVGLSTLTTSNEVTISGMTGTNVPVSATASSGGSPVSVELIVGGIPLGSSSGTINNGQTLRLRMTSAAVVGSTTTALVTIGSGSAVDWNIQTVFTVDTAPDFFNFTNQTGVAAGAAIDSNIVTITGINSPAVITTTSGALVSVNGGAFVAPTSGTTILNNQTLQLRLTSSSTPGGSASTTVSIGDPITGQVTDEWQIDTTTSGDTTPDDFAFVNKTNQLASTQVYSNTVVIQGITSPATVAISGASGAEFSIDGGPYTSSSSTISDGQTLSLRYTTGAYGSPTATINISVGTLSKTWQVSVLGSAPTSLTTSTWYNADVGKKLDGLAIGTVISVFKDSTGSWGNLDGSLTSRYPGFIECDGRTLNAVDYPDLFSVLERRYGGTGAVVTSGSTKTYSGTFKLPNYKNRKIMGAGNVDGNSASSPILPTAVGPDGTGSGGGTIVGSEGGSWYIATLDASGPSPREQVYTGGQDGEFFKLGTIRTTGYDQIASGVGFNIAGNTTQTVGPLQERIVSAPLHTHEIVTATVSSQNTGLISWGARTTFGGSRRVNTNNISSSIPGGPSIGYSFFGTGSFYDATISYSNWWSSNKDGSLQLLNNVGSYMGAIDVQANTASAQSYSPPGGVLTHSHYLSLNTYGNPNNVFGWGNNTGGGTSAGGMSTTTTVDISFTTSELGSTLNDGDFQLSNSKQLIPTVNLRPNSTVPLMTRYFRVKYLIKAY